jgi:hypothetical protein
MKWRFGPSKVKEFGKAPVKMGAAETELTKKTAEAAKAARQQVATRTRRA